jgi:hypothetical protein
MHHAGKAQLAQVEVMQRPSFLPHAACKQAAPLRHCGQFFNLAILATTSTLDIQGEEKAQVRTQARREWAKQGYRCSVQ